MDNEIVVKELSLEAEVNEISTYSLYQYGINVVREITINNHIEEVIENAVLRINSNNNVIVPFEQGINIINVSEQLHLDDIKLMINGDYLASLTERITAIVHIGIYKDDNELKGIDKEITVLAYDEWPGLRYYPDILASYIMPNHPVVANLILAASKYLDSWTGSASLNGYQSGDPTRIKNMAAAVYAAIQEKNITYAVPPASFEAAGQRVRLADTILEQHLGTCLDMTLLYVACLEAMGLNAFVVFIKGHVFPGVWLVERSFSDLIVDDPSQIEKRMSNGINELLVVEATAMCSGKTKNFDDAIKYAKGNVARYDEFEFAVDMLRARTVGIRPLPIRIKTDTGFSVQHSDRDEHDVTVAPTSVGHTYDLSNTTKAVVTKQVQWERKLLDLSMRNLLINMRLTKSVVPVLSADVGTLEDALSDGDEFQVLPRPIEWDLHGPSVITMEGVNDLGPYKDFIALEGKQRKLHSLYDEAELVKTLTKMYRTAKTSLEENGASTLYMAIGLLRWFEGGKKQQEARYAPIVLVPIEISRRSANKGYVLRMRDDESNINITLLEFLKQNFNLEIAGLDPIPKDDHGLDIEKIFAIIRHAVMSMPMWDVIESSFIGNFSFTQFVMWKDIHSRSDMLNNSKIIHSLMDGALNWDCTVPDYIDNDDAYLPIAVDGSQLHAIKMAANDVSFVLHGPPGTGKSQTITAMIANALAKGKRVLFVAEKMAALEVVEKRLDSLGIGEFCFELHSNKANKKDVLKQLKAILDIGAPGNKTNYTEQIEELKKIRSKIDVYVQELHMQRNSGYTFRELIDMYEDVPYAEGSIRFERDYVLNMVSSKIKSAMYLVERLVSAGRGVGHPHNNPLYRIKQVMYTQNLKMDINTSVSEYKDALILLKERSNEIKDILDLDICVKRDLEKIIGLKEACESIIIIPDYILMSESVEKAFIPIMDYMRKALPVAQRKQQALMIWNEDFLQLDMNSYEQEYNDAIKKLLGKDRALKILATKLQSFAKTVIMPENIPALLANVKIYQSEKAKIENDYYLLEENYRKLIDKYEDINTISEFKSFCEKQIDNLGEYKSKIIELKKTNNYGPAIEMMNKAEGYYNEYKSIEKETVDLLMLDMDLNSDANWIDDNIAMCDQIIANSGMIKEWVVYQQVVADCKLEGLENVCDAYEQGIPHDDLVNVFLRSLYSSMIFGIIETVPTLNSFTGAGFNEMINHFRKIDEMFLDLSKKEIYYRISSRIPFNNTDIEISRELNILRRAISSNGRGMSIRSLFDQIPTVLGLLCPCMLMSPISVAQYISPDCKNFDLVIFDEASQLPTCKAIGVLARGNNAVIVGDPNQMPPTSFFAGNSIDEDNLDIEDLDSILDDCLALGMPQTHLKWHYRSKHESLIAFSNHEFYDNKMLTFPSKNDREKRVSFIKCDGYFARSKGRVNEAEADAIVNEILRRYKDKKLKEQSIGVVTFNVTQQTLIEDKLQIEFSKNSKFDAWANDREERLFVKNLENVQGDERDVILFSIAYGPDSEGKLLLNFGPLNKDGGWKRLNVAVSRARQEMVVFSTMTADMIDLSRTKAKGVEALKGFLDFAEKGKLGYSYIDANNNKANGIEDRICRAIADAGYEYQVNVGHSDFKVDIAVVNLLNSDEYLLGIMLDGDSYKNATYTRDREISQVAVLESLGWTVHRIWTMDFWDNMEREISNVIKLISEQKKIYEQALEQEKEELVSSEELDDADNVEEITKIDAPKEEKNEGSVIEFTNVSESSSQPDIIIEQVDAESKIAGMMHEEPEIPSITVSNIINKDNSRMVRRGERVDLSGYNNIFDIMITSDEVSNYFNCYAFMLAANNKVSSEKDIICLDNAISVDGGVNVIDDRIHIDLSKVDNKSAKIAIVFALKDSSDKARIGMMNDPKVVIVNDNNELFNIPISDLMNERSLVAGELYQKNGVWKMNFICLGYTNGVEAIYEMYGGK